MPLIDKQPIEGGLLILWKLTETIEELLANNNDLQNNFNQLDYKHNRRKREWLISRILLKEIDCSPNNLSHNNEGAPILSHSNYHFISISHSSTFAGLFIHPTFIIGLDIESINRNFTVISGKYMSSKEQITAKQLPNGYALFWSIKEAVYKAAGIPGLNLAQEIQIESRNDCLLASVKTETVKEQFKIHYFLRENQIIVCVLKDDK